MKKLLSVIGLSFLWTAIMAQSNVNLPAQFAVTSQWDTGYVATISINNPFAQTISSWQLTFNLPSGQTVSSLWNGTAVTNNQQIIITNASWNGTIAQNQTVTVGLQINNPSADNPSIANLQAVGNQTTTSTAVSLNAQYSIDSTWPTGYETTVTITNPNSSATSSWSATFQLPAGQTVSSLWNGSYTVSGQTVTINSNNTNGIIPGGGFITFGLVVNNSNSSTPALNNCQATANGSAPTTTIPVAPVLSAIAATGQNYTVSWNSVANALSYVLQQDSSAQFSAAITAAQGNILSKAFTNQAVGTYYYRVNASNSAGTSAYSATQSVTIAATPTVPAAPTLNAITATGQNYTVSWNAVSGATSYTLQQSTSANFSSATAVAQGNILSFAVTNQAAGTYYYRVSATNSAGTSAYSATQSVTITTTIPTTKHTIEGYWESWDSSVSISTIVGMHADIIDIAFATFQSTGNNTFTITGINANQSTVTQLVTAAHAAGKKVKLSVGGESYPFSSFLTSATAAQGMAQAVATYVQANNIDGVDYDIEDYPAANLQIALIQATRQLLPNALISYTPETPASSTSPYKQVIQGAYQYLNQINLMCYDAGSSYSYQSDISALIAMGIPASIIVVGLMPGADDEGKVTSVANIQTAADYIISQNLAGIMFWDLNRDHLNTTKLGVDAATDAAYAILQ
ncbi:MAG: cellulose binding domain-containing protein [Candidatus Babeliales bacterium]